MDKIETIEVDEAQGGFLLLETQACMSTEAHALTELQLKGPAHVVSLIPVRRYMKSRTTGPTLIVILIIYE